MSERQEQPMSPDGSATVEIGVAPEAVWAAVADVTRHGDWSVECERAEWTGEVADPVEGATFTGYNAVGEMRWEAPCTVVDARPGAVFAYRVGEPPDGTVWRWELESTGGGTRVTHSFHAPDLLKDDYPYPGRDQMLQAGVEETVQRLKATLEA